VLQLSEPFLEIGNRSVLLRQGCLPIGDEHRQRLAARPFNQ